MKKIILSLFVLALAHQFTVAQCNPAIPNSAYVISSTQAIGFGGSNLWVCSGDTLTTNGGSNTVFLEIGAFLYANGGSNYVYVPIGAKIDLSSGSNTIYYVDTTDIISAGGAPIINKCASIAYDYTNAPAGGCTFTTGMAHVNVENTVSVYPNPGKGIFTITLRHPELVSSAVAEQTTIIEIYNVLGEKVTFGMLKPVQHDYEVDLSNQPNGVYIIKISSAKEVITQKIILEK